MAKLGGCGCGRRRRAPSSPGPRLHPRIGRTRVSLGSGARQSRRGGEGAEEELTSSERASHLSEPCVRIPICSPIQLARTPPLSSYSARSSCSSRPASVLACRRPRSRRRTVLSDSDLSDWESRGPRRGGAVAWVGACQGAV